MNSVFELLGRVKPTSRFGQFSLGVVAAFALLNLCQWIFGWPSGRAGNGLLGLALTVIVFRYLFKSTRWLMQKLLWRLRRRLLVTYVLIGIVPFILLFLIIWIASFLVLGQLASFFVNHAIDDLNSDLETTALSMAGSLFSTISATRPLTVEDWRAQLTPWLGGLDAGYSQVWIDAQSGDRQVALEYSSGRLAQRASGALKPAWLNTNTRGLFDDLSDQQVKLYMTAFVMSSQANAPGWLLLRAPIDASALDAVSKRTQVYARLGTLVPLPAGSPRRGVAIELDWEGKARSYRPGRIEARVDSPYAKKLAWYDREIFFQQLVRSRDWQTGNLSGDTAPLYYLNVESTWLHLTRRLFSIGWGWEGELVGYMLLGIAIIFLVIELGALTSAILITRTITGTVHNLDKAAHLIRSGDFSYRIPVKVRDQLSSLGDSFNSMTATIHRLLQQEAEKQRMESELAIAREVQQHLFPKEAPLLSRLQIAGTCRPARSVSGDYYDYLVIAPTTLGLALGDVSGKGVSAALLMASLQATLRSYLHLQDGNLTPAAEPDSGNGRGSLRTAEVMALLNRQLYQSTPAEKYATFFYAIYDEASGRLHYTNAGHLPPLVFTRRGVERLETGGMVVGLFENVQYAQGIVRFEPGDVLVAYTDGISEAENPLGEQFGEARLIELVAGARSKPPERILADILRAVSGWIETAEQQDDMTLIVTKSS